MARFDVLASRLRRVKRRLPGIDFRAGFRTIHCWRISDPLDYYDTSTGSAYDVAALADAWLTHLGQPLYVVTTGTLGNSRRRTSLEVLVANPEIVSQIKLSITPFDPRFERPSYIRQMAQDVATLWKLTEWSADRKEALGQPRFRINLKLSAHQRSDALRRVSKILKEAELPASLVEKLLGGDDARLRIKPVYDLREKVRQQAPVGAISLGSNLGQRRKADPVRDQYQLGFRPGGERFVVDLWGFHEHDNYTTNDDMRTFDDWFPKR